MTRPEFAFWIFGGMVASVIWGLLLGVVLTRARRPVGNDGGNDDNAKPSV